MINVNENLRQRGIDPMPDLRERPVFNSDIQVALCDPPTTRAKFWSECARCGKSVRPGDAIESTPVGWAHVECGDVDDYDIDEWHCSMRDAGDR